MIKSFKSKALKAYWERGETKGLIREHVGRIGRILDTLQVVSAPAGMMLPGYDTHELKGKRKGEWSSTVRANWRITYSFDGGDVIDVNYEDYH